MIAYIFRRLLLVIPTLIGIMVINFAIINAAPGAPQGQRRTRFGSRELGVLRRELPSVGWLKKTRRLIARRVCANFVDRTKMTGAGRNCFDLSTSGGAGAFSGFPGAA